MARLHSITTFLVLFVCLLVQALPGVAWAQSGKLSGTVTDAGTGEPIPGATVVLEGTTRGAATDVDGRYVIIGLNPASYNVRVSFVGYNTQVIADIRVTSDRTTTLDVQLTTEVVEGGEVIVEAERPVVDQNQTTSRSIVTGEEIAQLPVGSLQDVISRTANAYDGYIRGSRRFETKTMLEGVDISDTFYQLAPNANGNAYSGLVYSNTNRADETNASMFSLNPDALEEVTVNSGATDPRYATASGGVVAVTLAEQRGAITGSASFRMAPRINRPGPDSMGFYNDAADYFRIRDERRAAGDARADLMTWTEDTYAVSDDPEVDARFNLGGSITDNWTFSLNGQWFQTNGYQPNQFSKRLNGQVKTSYRFSSRSSVTAIGLVEDRGLWGGWNNRSYHDFFRYYLEGVAQNDAGAYLGSLKWTQLFSEKSFLDVQVYRTYKRNRYGYVDDDGDGFTEPGEDGDFIDFADPAMVAKYVGSGADKSAMFYENISDQFGDSGLLLPGGLRYRIAQPQPYSEDGTQVTNGFRLDYTNQVTFNHLLNAGVELKLRNFQYEEAYGLDQSGSKLNPTTEPYLLHDWERNPSELSFYASDRMEYAGLIVNLGLRVDVVDRDMDKIVDYYHPFTRDTIQAGIQYEAVMENGQRVVRPRLDAQGNEIPRMLLRNNFERGEAVPTNVFLNPSIGVSHPIGTSASMYFSYSRNQQLVPYMTLYSFYDGNSSNSPFFTYRDPESAPITSNNYELGVQWEFAPGWGADVNAYMRSIENYGEAILQAVNRNPAGEQALVGTFHNFATSAGYADVRGIELVLRRRPLRLSEDFTLGLTASYTYSSVEQSNFAGANQSQFQSTDPAVVDLPFDNARDFKNFPQNVRGGNSELVGGYDRTHRMVLRSVSSLPFGLNLGITGNLETGFLYPRVIGADPRDRSLLTGPTNYQIDLRLEKRFSFARRFGVDVYVDVTNLTNHQNIVAYETTTPDGPATFQRTGAPGIRLIQPDGTSLYGPARNVYFGSRVRF